MRTKIVSVAAATIVLLTMPISICGGQTTKENAEKMKLPLENVRVALVTGEGFQDEEALMPLAFLENHGAEVTVIGPERGEVKAYNRDVHLLIEADAGEVSAENFDALVLPGGKAPAKIREKPEVVALVSEIFQAGKPVAAICHGPQVLIKAGVVDGKSMTAYEGVANELRAAGAYYKDEAVVRDGNLVTSRLPKDIPQWLSAMQEMFMDAGARR